MAKTSNEVLKSFKKLSRQRFSCELDSDKALKVWLKSHNELTISEQEIFKQSSRTKLNQQPDSYEYQITGQLYWS